MGMSTLQKVNQSVEWEMIGPGIFINGVARDTLSHEVTLELSPDDLEKTRLGLAFWLVMCMVPVIPGTDNKLKWLEPGKTKCRW